MAVNYGLGGFESEFGFAAVSLPLSDPFDLTIPSANTYVNVVDAYLENQVLGNGSAGIFSNAYHQVDFVDLGKLEVKTSGVYLINYNLTTADPSNKTVAVRIIRYTDRENAIGGVQSGYCRSGDQFEIGSNCLSFLNSGDKIYTQITNTDGDQKVTITSLNISLVKLNYSGSKSTAE
tara:strand:+ start:1564 stop:2094 length:531 start_codon:yes stop_codon:yes gene_type:complete